MIADKTEKINTPWSLNHKEVLLQLQADENRGLRSGDAARRLGIVGYNSIEASQKTSVVKIILDQFLSPFVLLLGIAAAVSFYFNEVLDGIAIIIVILINAFIAFIMEFQAERSMNALKNLTTVPAKVMRDGKLLQIPSEEVVPGDILFVESGDMITADARLVKASQLQTDESALTGESLPVEKSDIQLSAIVSLAERRNMIYKGTFVNKGNAYAAVVHTGMSTELGLIAGMVQTADQTATPVEKKIQAFSKRLIWITVGILILIFFAGLLNGKALNQMLQTAIALAVAAIPEGLPIVATLALAFGMMRMARHNVIVKKLSSVETLGETTVICTDKTGTLTENKIEPSFIQIYNSESRIDTTVNNARIRFIDNIDLGDASAYQHLMQIAALCNTASYQKIGMQEKETGDPLEVSLLKMIHRTSKKQEHYQSLFTKVDEIPFSSETKVMATIHRNKGDHYIAAKGAVEELLIYCTSVYEGNEIVPLTNEKRRFWIKAAEDKAAAGLRMLAFAFGENNNVAPQKNFLQNLTLAGLIGFIDPPRTDVAAAVSECRSAGIKVVMITGDHPATAKNIAMQLGLLEEQQEVIHGNTMKPFKDLTTGDKKRWLDASVFARVTPRQKLDLVTLLQEKKLVVAMTGDGVNDAPALKKADIGIAMGQRGTQVAQEVADMILKDDAFSSIVLAIKQGRVIFDNIRKFVIYLLSCNLSELLIIATAAVLNLHFQFLPLQILFINLVTDVLPALALGVTEAAPHIMQRKPYASGVAIIDKKRWFAILAYSLVITITSICAVFTSHEFINAQEKWDAERCNNVLFYTLIFSQVLHVFNMSFEKRAPFHRTEIFRNKYVWYAVISCIILAILPYWILPVRRVLGIVIYRWYDWGIIFIFSFLSLFLIQFIKRKRWVI